MAGSLIAILLGMKEQAKHQIATLDKLPCLFQVGLIPREKAVTKGKRNGRSFSRIQAWPINQ